MNARHKSPGSNAGTFGQNDPRSDQFYRLFMLSPALLGIAGTDGYFKRVNPAFQDKLGHTEADLLSKPFIEFVHPDDRESTLNEVSKLATGTPAVHFENRYRHANGSYRWLLWNTTPVVEEGLLYATAIDITERKQADERYLNLLSALPDSIIVTDQQGNILVINRATELLFGYASNELVGQSIEVLVPTRLRDKHRQHRNVYVKDARLRLMSGGIELHGLCKDGSEFPAKISLGPAGSGEGQIVICAVRDISVRQRREHDLQDSARRQVQNEQRLQSLANQLVLAEENERRRIARGLHDDVGQSLLAAKLTLDELLEDDLAEHGDASMQEMQSLLNQAIQSTRALTFELASAALYDVGLGAALQSLCESAAQRSGILFQPPESLKGNPISEPVRVILYRVCRELIQNIVKHSGAGSAKLSLTLSGNLVRLTVADDGCGFDIAQRLHSDDLATGFGLFSIDQQLRPIGGRLEIVSTRGSGTRAVVSVPIDAEGEGT